MASIVRDSANPENANPENANAENANPEGAGRDNVNRDSGSSESTTAPIASNVHQMAATKLAAASQRYTSNRRSVVDGLLATIGPATIAEILEQDGRLAQSSTYRNLVVLEEVGVVHRIVTSDDHARFELTEEITGHHHHHLICELCGAIVDVTLDPELERSLEQALGTAASNHGFSGHHHRVDLVGSCQACSLRTAPEAEASNQIRQP